MGMQKVCFYTVTEHTLENRGSKQIQLRYEWLVLGLGEFILTLASHISLRFSTSAQSFAVSTESISVFNHQHCLPSMRHKKWELQTSCCTKKMQMSPLSKALRVYCQGGRSCAVTDIASRKYEPHRVHSGRTEPETETWLTHMAVRAIQSASSLAYCWSRTEAAGSQSLAVDGWY